MAAATVNAYERVHGIHGEHDYDLTFAASGDTHTVTFKVRTFVWALRSITANGSVNQVSVDESSGVFTLSINGTATTARINLRILEQK